jgi:hypothetical protein
MSRPRPPYRHTSRPAQRIKHDRALDCGSAPDSMPCGECDRCVYEHAIWCGDEHPSVIASFREVAHL